MGGPREFEPEEGPIRVLIVEDDSRETVRLRASLEQSAEVKFEIDCAVEVEAALEVLCDAAHDVVLLDLSLPEGHGLDTLSRARIAASSVPIIALTHEDDPAQARRAVRMGAQDYLLKGAEPHQLIRTLLKAVERHRLLSELQLARQREHYLATHDRLTGLANRYALEDQLERALAFAERAGRNVAVMFIDLDRFKNINDTLGHPIGDRLLQLATARLKCLVRRSDMLARLGGDEFILMLQGIEHDRSAARVAESILDQLAGPYALQGHHYRVTGSIGIAVYPRDGISVEALVRNADTAMYEAKSAGGNAFRFFDHSMNESVLRRVTLECRLREAFENGQLKVFYQPKVRLDSGEIVGSEALLRWTDPELGAISPAEFIPLAEEAGLIREIGDWTLRTACAQTRRWQQAGYPSLRIAVNISACQIAAEDLRHTIASTLWDTDLRADSLELELTESVLMNEDAATLDALQKIKKIGVGLSLDDFGTGFSSLSYLKAIPIDTLKIDRSFVRDYGLDPDDAAIIAAVLSIAEKLELNVVAEGVETERQRVLLQAAGCHEFQGFLYSPAVSSEAFLELLRQQPTRG